MSRTPDQFIGMDLLSKPEASFHSSWIGELLPDLAMKAKSLTCLLGGHRKSLIRLNPHSNRFHDIT